MHRALPHAHTNSDKLDDDDDKPARLLGHVIGRVLLCVAAYNTFPLICNFLAPIMHVNDVAMTDRVRAGLTGSFLPGISLLFGTLFSYTISLLVNRQNRIEELVNQVCAAAEPF
jgi:Protein of unknown function (DUF4239)